MRDALYASAIALTLCAAIAPRPAARADGPTPLPHAPTLLARYLMDEPHASPSPEATWVAQVLDAAIAGEPLAPVGRHAGEAPRDLFRHGGPGPAGSEWNSDADLLFLVAGPASTPPPTVVVWLDRTPLRARVDCGASGCVGSLVIASSRWLARLRPARATDARRLALDAVPAVGLEVLSVRARGRWSRRPFSVEAAFARASGE